MSHQEQRQYLRKLADMVATHGHAVVGVVGTAEEPSLSYTVGLVAAGLPELVIVGVDPEIARSILNDLAERMRGGRMPPTDTPLDFVFKDFYAILKRVTPAQARDRLLFACDFNGGAVVEALQVVWPDRQGRFPFDVGFSAEMRAAQPLLFDLH